MSFLSIRFFSYITRKLLLSFLFKYGNGSGWKVEKLKENYLTDLFQNKGIERYTCLESNGSDAAKISMFTTRRLQEKKKIWLWRPWEWHRDTGSSVQMVSLNDTILALWTFLEIFLIFLENLNGDQASKGRRHQCIKRVRRPIGFFRSQDTETRNI